MSVTLGALKTIINDIRADDTNGTVDIDVEGYRAINYIISDMNTRHDWEGSIEEYTLRYFPLQTRYILSSDFKCLISLYPVLNHVDDFLMMSPTVFNRKLITGFPSPMVAIEEGKYKRMKVYYPYSRAQNITLLSNSAYDDNGTWVASDDAASVATDTQQFTENNGSVRFNVTVAGSVNDYATLTKAMTNAVDLTTYRNSSIFTKFDIPDSIVTPALITGFNLKVGSSASDYYSMTITKQEDNGSFVKGINRLAFNMETATTTGSPDIANIDYVVLRMNFGSGMGDTNNFRFGAMYACNYEPIVVQYYMNKMVYDVSASEYVVKFDGTDDADYVLLPENADEVIESGASWRLLKQMEQPDNAEMEHKIYSDRLKDLMGQYPSRRKRPEAPKLGLGRW